MTQVHIVQRMSPGGIEQLVLSLALRAGRDIHVISLEGSAEELMRAWPPLRAIGDRLTALGKEAGSAPLLPFMIARELRRIGATSVVTHHAGPMIYGGAAARLAGISALTHVEHDAWHLGGRRRARLMRSASRLLRPDLAAVSPLVAEAAERAYGKPVLTIANGVDLARFAPRDRSEARARLGLAEDCRVIGAAGRLERVKGFDLLIEAVASMPENVCAVIFGEGSEATALNGLVRMKGLQGRVILAGRGDAMERVYPAFDVFCQPSRFEGLPLAILEAQACGMPVVAHDVGGMAGGVCPRTGRLLPAGHPQLLAAVLAERLATPLEANPRDFVADRYSLDQTARAYAGLEGNHAHA